MSQYFPKPFGRDINVKIDLANYITKTELKNINLSYFKRKKHFDESGAQNYLVFQSMIEYFTLDDKWITKWRSKGLSNENLEVVSTSDNALSPEINYNENKSRLKFNGSILQQKIVTYNHKKAVNIYIVYKITKFRYNTNPILTNALFGAVKITKNHDVKKYNYSEYGIGFDSQTFYNHPSGGIGRDVIIFGVDMSLSINTANCEKTILILGKGPVQRLDERSLSAEKMYSINFTKTNKKFCLSLHYNGANSYLFVNGTEIHKFIAKEVEINPYNLCIGNISKDFSVTNMQKTGFNGYIYDFSVDYDPIDVDNIKDIHKYLMKKNGIV